MTYEEAENILGPDLVAALPPPGPLTDAQLERLGVLLAPGVEQLPDTA